MSKIIGIDLGTTNSAVAVIEGGKPTILENAEGNRTTPSIVGVSKTGERLAGLLAKRQAVTNPTNTITGIKRFIGHSYDEDELQKNLENVPFESRKSENGGVEVKMGEEWHRPEEISAFILQKIKADAEAKLGEKVTEAVITVPAYFNDDQRQATKDAGKIAGFDVKRIINEPTAAALSYGFDKKNDQKIAVFDFGGGTFDVSVLEVGDDVIEVKSTAGDHNMGGRDIDGAIIDHIAEQFKNETGIDLKKDKLALQRLDEAAEKAKLELSSSSETNINIPFISSGDEGPVHLDQTMTRSQLEQIAEPYITKAIDITKSAVKDSPFELSEIDEVILVGGQTRMPKIAQEVEALFGKEPNKSINPDEVVALGAAIQAGILQGDVKDVLLLDVTPLTLGIETMGGVATPLIEKNTTIPASQSQVFSTAADNQTSTEIHVVQGERPMAADNKSLGKFVLDGIPPAPRGVPQIEVTFDLDANGILQVKAKDKTSGKENSIRIEGSSGLSEDEINKMQADAEAHAEEDAKKKELVELRNSADQTIFMAEKALTDAGESVDEDTKKAIQEKIDALKEVKDKDDQDEIKQKMEGLSTEVQKIAEQMAQSQAGQAEQAGEGEQGDTNADAQDAEVVDEEDSSTDSTSSSQADSEQDKDKY
jgi:molecular chaperone DnaK